MAIFKKNDGGVLDTIRCDESDYLIWKWHPQGTTSEKSQRANAIRAGSSLRVKDGSVAVFVYPQANGEMQDYIEGPYDKIIETANFPVLASLVGKLYDGGSPFQAEVYFINLAGLIQIKFGVPYFDIFDPRFLDFGVPAAVRGSMSFSISDYRKFVRLHRLDNFDMNAFQMQVKDAIVRYTKETVANAPSKCGIPVVQIERHLSEINSTVKEDLTEIFQNDFGVTLSRVDISDIELNKESSGYKKLLSLTQNKAAVFTQAASNIFTTMNAQRSGSKNITQTAKGDNTTTKKDRNAATAGHKFSSIFSGALEGLKKSSKGTPPPIPHIQYFAVINGEQTGPFNLAKLGEMLTSGEITSETLVWKEGMKDWEQIEKVKELKPYLNAASDDSTVI